MKKIRNLFLFFLSSVVISTALYAKPIVKIGVLAHKKYESTFDMWGPTAAYLNTKIPEYDFYIVPLRFEEFPTYLRDNKINFVITNSAYYVDLERRYGISRIASLKNRDLNGKAQMKFGGVIFTSRSNTAIEKVEDLKDKTFGAVDEDSFGGWIMALREFKEDNIASEDLKVTFYRTHEAVVNAVRDGKAEAGTVRTDTLERMADEGKIHLNDFTIIHQKNYPDFHYRVSTRLYPEWPIAMTKYTSLDLAEKVAVALISMEDNSEAARASKSLGWTVPYDYQSIHECLRELELGPYKHLRDDAFSYVIKKYWLYISIAFILLVYSIAVTFYGVRINVKLKDAHKELALLKVSLEELMGHKRE